ncbi:MAG: haloacid dehalogenase-like hydrolase [Endomicrobia bacterium]|nr:haloacid dehalogenase-like hydrolase [Endomicrobiia bacterium]
MKNNKFAICYDFDDTLLPYNMQDNELIPSFGINKDDFWQEVIEYAKDYNADTVLVYMLKIIEKAAASKNVKLTKETLAGCGRKIAFFNGVKTWFERINFYGKKLGVEVEHYIISSGLKEMIEGAEIAGEFKQIYASSYIYDQNGEPKWPAFAVNYTNKTQFLFRISKGCFDINNNREVNKLTDKKDIYVPFTNMVYIGDGFTDVPCMKLLKDKGGNSIAVYNQNSSQKKHEAETLLKDKRVNFIAPADYGENSELEKYIKKILNSDNITPKL